MPKKTCELILTGYLNIAPSSGELLALLILFLVMHEISGAAKIAFIINVLHSRCKSRATEWNFAWLKVKILALTQSQIFTMFSTWNLIALIQFGHWLKIVRLPNANKKEMILTIHYQKMFFSRLSLLIQSTYNPYISRMAVQNKFLNFLQMWTKSKKHVSKWNVIPSFYFHMHRNVSDEN